MKKNSIIKSAIVTFAIACMFMVPLSAHAEGKATVTVQSANIRSSASASSQVVAGVMKNDTLEIISSETDASGYTWYKVYVDANSTGYIRSDLVTTEGASSTTQSTTTTTSTSTVTSVEPTPDPVVPVTEVEPLSATVTGEVRVRKGPSTSTEVVETAKQGTTVTVIGYANAAKDNTLWYHLTYTSNTSNVEGFIRNDFVKLSGELVDKVEEPEVEEPEVVESVVEEVPEVEVYKDFEAVYDATEDCWYLNNYIEGTHIKVQDLYDAQADLKTAENEAKLAIKKKNGIIIALGVIIAALVAAGIYAYIRFRQWYYGYEEDTEEPVNTNRVERAKETKTYTKEPEVRVKEQRTSNVKAQTVGERQPSYNTVNPSDKAPVLKGIPEGGVRLPDGRIQMPDGSIRRAVVGVKLPDGSIKLPDGRIRKPDGTIVQAADTERHEEPVRTAPSTQSVREVPLRTASQLTVDDDDMEFGFLNLDSNLSDD